MSRPPDEDEERDDELEQAREAARQEAFAAADQELSPEEEAARAPGQVRGAKRDVPVSVLIAAMVALGLIAFLVVKLMPAPVKRVPGAHVVDLPEKRLQVVANVVGADVFVHDSFIGKTPLDLENDYPFGQLEELTVRAFGFPEVPATFMGGRGQKVVVTFAPKPPEE